MGTVTWGEDIAVAYDAMSAAMYEPDVLGPTVNMLAGLADGGPALELAIGTGRVALALRERGFDVHGIAVAGPATRASRVSLDKLTVDALTGTLEV